MQRVVFDEPYTFIPPHNGKLWSILFGWYLPRYHRKANGIVAHEIRHIDRLKESMRQGHGIVIAPNHPRPSDPMVLGFLQKAAGTMLNTMASWHIFKQDRMQAFMARRFGAFSIYREGMDRTAINCAIDILEHARRPLVIFPEGVISRTNGHLGSLMDGTAFIARSAAKKRDKQTSAGKVVIHPVALKYVFLGDVETAVRNVLRDIEHRLTWHAHEELPLFARIEKVGQTLLSLKEIEYLGESGTGEIYHRIRRLIDHLLHPLETEWLKETQSTDVVSRVKRLRSEIVSGMVGGDVGKAERDRRWRQLADCYLAQQLSFYRPNYLRGDSPPERFLETVERFEEDLTDASRVHTGWKVIMEICEPIEVAPKRDRGSESDPAMDALQFSLESTIAKLTQEVAEARALAAR
ncbi:MAG: 1-acyl-sn-glycerol-3-phosphate acyltransferase [Planctomycetota bacterium]|nr:1-acyl-sn-glycerol-3-phosphate acyltransferase [Planctomycetota bacterium]